MTIQDRIQAELDEIEEKESLTILWQWSPAAAPGDLHRLTVTMM